MRIVALTLDPSLGAALNMLDDWEITSAHDVDALVEVARGAAIVLIGVGGTEEGLDIAQQIHSRGVTIPALVVGEGPVPPAPFAPVLLRPFSLDDLRSAVTSAIGDSPSRAFTPAPPREDPDGEGSDQSGAVVVELRPSVPAPPSVEPAARPETPPPPPPARAVPDKDASPAARSAASVSVQPKRVDPAEIRRRLVTPRKPLPTATPKAEPKEEPSTRRRGFGRRTGAATVPDESPLIRRLRAAATAARDIEQLIEELPVIADLSVMTDAFLNEAVSAFAPQIASVYWHEGTTFRIVASHGLSRVEQGLTVQESQPLFEQVLLSSEPVLIAPVDLARGLVVGVAGARTEALMVGPVHVDGVCIAALVVGRNDFSDADLDRMATLAHEAGPGLALARALQGLRAKY